jgi:hypothetical protein
MNKDAKRASFMTVKSHVNVHFNHLIAKSFNNIGRILAIINPLHSCNLTIYFWTMSIDHLLTSFNFFVHLLQVTTCLRFSISCAMFNGRGGRLQICNVIIMHTIIIHVFVVYLDYWLLIIGGIRGMLQVAITCLGFKPSFEHICKSSKCFTALFQAKSFKLQFSWHLFDGFKNQTCLGFKAYWLLIIFWLKYKF